MCSARTLGRHGVVPAIDLLQDEQVELRMKIGAIRCLRSMVSEPFRFTFSVNPTPAEIPEVTGAWRLWWERNQSKLEAVDPEARKFLDGKLAVMVAAPDKLYATIDAVGRQRL